MSLYSEAMFLYSESLICKVSLYMFVYTEAMSLYIEAMFLYSESLICKVIL